MPLLAQVWLDKADEAKIDFKGGLSLEMQGYPEQLDDRRTLVSRKEVKS